MGFNTIDFRPQRRHARVKFGKRERRQILAGKLADRVTGPGRRCDVIGVHPGKVAPMARAVNAGCARLGELLIIDFSFA